MDLFAYEHTYAYLFKGSPGEILNKEQGKRKGRIRVVCCPFCLCIYVCACVRGKRVFVCVYV